MNSYPLKTSPGVVDFKTAHFADPKAKVVEQESDGKAAALASQVRSLVKGESRGKSKGGKGGLKPLRLIVPYSFSMSTGATGIVASAIPVSVDSNTAEWSALSALYDEYRVEGGRVELMVSQLTTVGPLLVDNMLVFAWDPVDGSALSGVRAGTELAQHILKAPSPVVGAAAGVATNTTKWGFLSSTGKPYTLAFSTGPAKALSINSTGAVSASPGAWKSTLAAGSNNPDGWLKAYVTLDTASLTGVTGIVYLRVEFRSRK